MNACSLKTQHSTSCCGVKSTSTSSSSADDQFVHTLSASKKTQSIQDMMTTEPLIDGANGDDHHHLFKQVGAPAHKTRPLSLSSKDVYHLQHQASQTTAQAPQQPHQPHQNTQRHSCSASTFTRGKHPVNRDDQISKKKDQETTATKKGFFTRRREKKLASIEQKPVYKWNYKVLAKWLKYKGVDKKYVKLLKKDRLNGYIMLTLEVCDLIMLNIPSETARYILNALIELDQKQDVVIENAFDCELDLPSVPVKSSTLVSPSG